MGEKPELSKLGRLVQRINIGYSSLQDLSISGPLRSYYVDETQLRRTWESA